MNTDVIAGSLPTTAPQKHPLTDEQRAIVEAVPKHQVLVIEAGAGCGKTSSMVEVAESQRGKRGQYTAFNTALVAESKSKLPPWCPANTIHSLAFRSEGKRFSHRLNRGRVRASEVAAMLGLGEMTVVGTDDKEKVIPPAALATFVRRAVANFCQSADAEVGLHHFGRVTGVGEVEQERVRQNLLQHAQAMWQDLASEQGRLPYSHDSYVKTWQLCKPVISADYVLLDEAQDTSPVMLDVMAQQAKRGTRIVMVGDSAQQIYSWRGAVNALAAFPSAKRLMLSQSFRFGDAIAAVANSILSELYERGPLVLRGFSRVRSTLATESLDDPRCVLCRTNAMAVQTVLAAIKAGKRPHLIGGGAEVLAFVEAACELKAGHRTSHPELCCFGTWREVVAFSKEEEGEELRLLVKLIEQFGAEAIVEALRNMPDETDADVVVTTVHRSKGKQWQTVQLAPDFQPLSKTDDEGIRLLYVAATRAQQVLDVESCAPFTGGQRDGDERERTIDLTEARRLSKIVAAGLEQDAVASIAGAIGESAAEEQNEDDAAEQAPAERAVPNTWVKGNGGGWLICGRAGQTGVVTVTKRSGQTSQERLGQVVWSGNGLSYYKVAT